MAGHFRGCVACHQSQCCLWGVGGAAVVVARANEQLWFSELPQPSVSLIHRQPCRAVLFLKPSKGFQVFHNGKTEMIS
jgi:hypothetical protein